MTISYFILLIVWVQSETFASLNQNSYNYDYDEIDKDYPDLNHELILRSNSPSYPNFDKRFAIQRNIERFGPPYQEQLFNNYGNNPRYNSFQNQRVFPNKKNFNNPMQNSMYDNQIYDNKVPNFDQTQEQENFLPYKDNFLPEERNVPLENENFPSENKIFPPVNENSPLENENFSPENENFPIENESLSPENHTETDQALPKTEMIIKTSVPTTISSVPAKSAKRATSNSKLSKRQRSAGVRNLDFKRTDSLGKWFDKEMSDVEPEKYGNTDNPKAVESREAKLVKKPSRRGKIHSQKAEDPSESNPLKMWENTRRYPHLKRYAQNPNSEIFPRDYPESIRISYGLDYPEPNNDALDFAADSQQKFNDPNTLGETNQPGSDYHNFRPALREAPVNQYRTLPNVPDSASKNIVVTVAGALQEKSKDEKSNLIDKTNDVLSKEILKSPNVEEKMQRVVENFRTKKTLVNDKKLQQETSVVENEKQKVNDNVHVKSEEKVPNKTETTTELLTTYGTLSQEQFGKHFFPPDQEKQNKNFFPNENFIPPDQGFLQPDEERQNKNFLPNENFIPPDQSFPNPDYDLPNENIVPNESPYSKGRPILTKSGIPQTDNQNIDAQSDIDSKPISFKIGETVVVTSDSSDTEQRIQSIEQGGQSATTSDDAGKTGGLESTTDIFNVSMPDIYLKEEKVEKQSNTLLRSKEAFRNKTAVVKGQRKSEIKNNKESFHEVFVEEKGEDKYPSRVEDDAGKYEKKLSGFQNKSPFSNTQNKNDRTQGRFANSPSGSRRRGPSNEINKNNSDDYRSDYQGGENVDKEKLPGDKDYSYYDYPKATNYKDVNGGERLIDNTASKSDPRFLREPMDKNIDNSEENSNEMDNQSNIHIRGVTESENQQAAGNVVYFPPTTTTSQYNDFLNIREGKSYSVQRRHLHSERT